MVAVDRRAFIAGLGGAAAAAAMDSEAKMWRSMARPDSPL